jgi:hypothetical protein
VGPAGGALGRGVLVEGGRGRLEHARTRARETSEFTGAVGGSRAALTAPPSAVPTAGHAFAILNATLALLGAPAYGEALNDAPNTVPPAEAAAVESAAPHVLTFGSAYLAGGGKGGVSRVEWE